MNEENFSDEITEDDGSADAGGRLQQGPERGFKVVLLAMAALVIILPLLALFVFKFRLGGETSTIQRFTEAPRVTSAAPPLEIDRQQTVFVSATEDVALASAVDQALAILSARTMECNETAGKTALRENCLCQSPEALATFKAAYRTALAVRPDWAYSIIHFEGEAGSGKGLSFKNLGPLMMAQCTEAPTQAAGNFNE